MVFDSGDGVSHSVPVFEGYCLPHAVQRFPLAGADVTMQLKKVNIQISLHICYLSFRNITVTVISSSGLSEDAVECC